MERLTYWNEELGCWSYHCASGEVAKRLAAYEDTGLMPKAVEFLLDAYIDNCIETAKTINSTPNVERVSLCGSGKTNRETEDTVK